MYFFRTVEKRDEWTQSFCALANNFKLICRKFFFEKEYVENSIANFMLANLLVATSYFIWAISNLLLLIKNIPPVIIVTGWVILCAPLHVLHGFPLRISYQNFLPATKASLTQNIKNGVRQNNSKYITSVKVVKIIGPYICDRSWLVC